MKLRCVFDFLDLNLTVLPSFTQGLTYICTAISASILVSSNHLYRSVGVGALFSLPLFVSDNLFERGLHQLLINLLSSSAHEVSSAAGRCLCYLLTHVSLEYSLHIGSLILPTIMVSLLHSSYDLDLLLVSLTSLHHILTLSRHQSDSISGLVDRELHDVLSQLSMEHQYPQNICQTAITILEALDRERDS
jgi:hypothetical protein